jgi:hypothetical protein
VSFPKAKRVAKGMRGTPTGSSRLRPRPERLTVSSKPASYSRSLQKMKDQSAGRGGDQASRQEPKTAAQSVMAAAACDEHAHQRDAERPRWQKACKVCRAAAPGCGPVLTGCLVKACLMQTVPETEKRSVRRQASRKTATTGSRGCNRSAVD